MCSILFIGNVLKTMQNINNRNTLKNKIGTATIKILK